MKRVYYIKRRNPSKNTLKKFTEDGQTDGQRNDDHENWSQNNLESRGFLVCYMSRSIFIENQNQKSLK